MQNTRCKMLQMIIIDYWSESTDKIIFMGIIFVPTARQSLFSSKVGYYF